MVPVAERVRVSCSSGSIFSKFKVILRNECRGTMAVGAIIISSVGLHFGILAPGSSVLHLFLHTESCFLSLKVGRLPIQKVNPG